MCVTLKQCLTLTCVTLNHKLCLLSNELLTINAATAEQTTASKKDDQLITKIMLDTLSKVKKSYLISGINEIENQFESLENYIIQELGFTDVDIKDLKKLYCN